MAAPESAAPAAQPQLREPQDDTTGGTVTGTVTTVAIEVTTDDADGADEERESDALLPKDDSIYEAPSVEFRRRSAGKTTAADARRGFWLVVIAGTIWGGGALFAKLMEDPTKGIAEYLVVRTGTISLCLFLMILKRPEALATLRRVVTNPLALGWAGLVGMVAGGGGMSCFVISMSFIPAANTLCIMAAGPFFAAFMERVIFGTRLSSSMKIATTTAGAGVLVIGGEGLLLQENLPGVTAAGALFGNLCAVGTAVLSATLSTMLVALKDVPGAGFIVSMLGTLLIMCGALLWTVLDGETDPETGSWFSISAHNAMLSWAVGMCIGVGMVFYNLGAVFITAAQMQLLQMTEVVSGTILVLLLKVWAPDKGEVPSVLATVGGLMICGAIAGQGYAMQRQQPPLDGEGNDKGGTESGKDSSANA